MVYKKSFIETFDWLHYLNNVRQELKCFDSKVLKWLSWQRL